MKPYQKLRGALRGADIDQAYLGQLLDCGPAYVSSRMNAHKPWNADEMYFLMKELNLPLDQMHVYFPPKGVALPEKMGVGFRRLHVVTGEEREAQRWVRAKM